MERDLMLTSVADAPCNARQDGAPSQGRGEEVAKSERKPENSRKRWTPEEIAREAHRFGFWAWAGPANDAEQAEIEKAEGESWEEFRANTAPLPLSDKE